MNEAQIHEGGALIVQRLTVQFYWWVAAKYSGNCFVAHLSDEGSSYAKLAANTEGFGACTFVGTPIHPRLLYAQLWNFQLD